MATPPKKRDGRVKTANRRTSSGEKQPARVKRPKLPRTEPLRDFSTLFGQPGRTVEGAKPPRTGSAPDWNRAVERGVELGYRVIDEYVRQGQAIAGSFRRPGRPEATPESDVQRVTERMVHNASELANAWLDFVRTAAGGGARSAAAGDGAPGPDPVAAAVDRARQRAPKSDVAADTTGSEARNATVEVVTERKASVRLDFQRNFAGSLVVHDLRGSGAKPARIAGAVTISEAGGQPLVRVTVPKKSPTGTYSAAIVERDTSVTVGTLTLHILS